MYHITNPKSNMLDFSPTSFLCALPAVSCVIESGVKSVDNSSVESIEDNRAESVQDSEVESIEETGVESVDDSGVESVDDSGIESVKDYGVKSVMILVLKFIPLNIYFFITNDVVDVCVDIGDDNDDTQTDTPYNILRNTFSVCIYTGQHMGNSIRLKFYKILY
ncbi:hypothetical protein FF38_00203 [Lucilia cuprina]|uniref:Uncharacterized protein n=1 Tax=Lucilia cuprina TaxID=7375 RepID=A0A0L0BRB9_LUCCU|nr:hypothetical protein FF38_00203 [Lucilia cuprina]